MFDRPKPTVGCSVNGRRRRGEGEEKKEVILHIYPPMKMEQTVCFETSAYKIQTPVNYPEESIQPY